MILENILCGAIAYIQRPLSHPHILYTFHRQLGVMFATAKLHFELEPDQSLGTDKVSSTPRANE